MDYLNTDTFRTASTPCLKIDFCDATKIVSKPDPGSKVFRSTFRRSETHFARISESVPIRTTRQDELERTGLRI